MVKWCVGRDFLRITSYNVCYTKLLRKRKKNLILTGNAINLLESARKLTQQVSGELLKGITESELEHFENVINKIQINTGYQQCLSVV